MPGPTDIRLSWFKSLTPSSPMIEPRLGVDDFENADTLEIINWPVPLQNLLYPFSIDDPTRGKPPAKYTLANRIAEMIKQPSGNHTPHSHARRDSQTQWRSGGAPCK